MEETLIRAVANFGFPAVMCLLMFIQMDRQQRRHKEETSLLTAAINNNTLAMNRLLLKLGVEVNGQ